MQRRTFSISLLACAAAAGCGFRLRQPPTFSFDSVFLAAPDSSPIAGELRRNLASTGSVQVLGASAQPQRAQVVFDLLEERRDKVVVGLSASGQVREFQLRMVLRFRLRTPQGRELIPETELMQQRDISFNESAVLAKESEEGLLYRDMQTSLVQQLMRRLAAVKTL